MPSFLPHNLSTPWGLLSALGLMLSLATLYQILGAFYLVYLHPLRKIPGPKIAACSRIPYVRKLLRGDLARWLRELHETYGDVVRIAPDEVSFISGETAWPQIYGTHSAAGNKGPAKGQYLKDRRWFAEPYNETWSVMQADAEAHPRMRKTIAPSFGEKGLREQEGLIQGYVDLFVQRLREQIEGPNRGVVDIVKWFNFFTFDIIADMTFGESFGCLQSGEYHPWVATLFDSVRAISLNSTIRRFPLLQSIVKRLAPKDLLEKRRAFNMWVFDRVDKRLATETAKPDLMTQIMAQDGGPSGMTRAEIHSNANIVLIAGSETTATLLSGAAFLLGSNPDKLRKLEEEIRGTFKQGSEVTSQSVANLPYLNAVLRESLRMYPPNAAGFMRLVPPEGDTISGHWIPGGTSVSVSQWPANHSTRNFSKPFTFAPERFLGAPEYENDNKAVLNPFSYGRRDCVGKTLAWVEMRLILSRLVLEFDMKLIDEKEEWLKNQKVYTLWAKTPLRVRLDLARTA